MSNWVYTSLVNSVGSLRDAGEDTLAADILRLVQSGQLQALKVFRNEGSEEVAGLIEEVRDAQALLKVLRSTAERFGARHATVHVVTETPSMIVDPRVVTTYPDDWISHYVAQAYAAIDPVILRARSSQGGFFWDTLDQGTETAARFFADADRFGVGRAGYTLPLRVWKDLRIALTLSSDRPDADFRLTLEPQLPDLEILGEQIIAAFADLASAEFRADRRPPLQLLHLLRALALGASLEEACARSGVTDCAAAEAAIRDFYGARTLVQAAMVAVRLKHLDALPFERSDIAPMAPPRR